MDKDRKYNLSFNIYKPNKDHTRGCASSWEFNEGTGTFFLSVAKQKEEKTSKGNFTFDWDNKCIMKLGSVELAELKLVFRGQKPCVGKIDGNEGGGFYHESGVGSNCILKMFRHKDRPEVFVMKISSKNGDKLFKSAHLITDSEAEYLATLFDNVIWQTYQMSGN